MDWLGFSTVGNWTVGVEFGVRCASWLGLKTNGSVVGLVQYLIVVFSGVENQRLCSWYNV
jgi:hypothetical protein